MTRKAALGSGDASAGAERELSLTATAELQTALDAVKAAGYVALKEKSYRQAQERQRVAEAFRKHAEEDAEHARAWARNCLDDERRMRDRITFVYGVARAHGATVEELRG